MTSLPHLVMSERLFAHHVMCAVQRLAGQTPVRTVFTGLVSTQQMVAAAKRGNKSAAACSCAMQLLLQQCMFQSPHSAVLEAAAGTRACFPVVDHAFSAIILQIEKATEGKERPKVTPLNAFM